MNLVAKFLLGYIVAHILLISIIEASICVNLKMIQLCLLILVLVIGIFNAKKIIIQRVDILIVFLLGFLNIYYFFIETRGLIFFKMTYALFLAIMISKVILPNISIKSYMRKFNFIYFVVLIFLIIEYLLVAFFGDKLLTDLFMCNGERTGVRGYIQLLNWTKDLGILPYHITGLNSIMMGSQTASQLSVIIFIWFLHKNKIDSRQLYRVLSYIAIVMLILSPSITSVLLFLISILIIYLLQFRTRMQKKIKNFYRIYVFFIVAFLLIFALIQILTFRYGSLNSIIQEYVLRNLDGFIYFDLQEILFGISLLREEQLFEVGEIAFLKHFLTYGFIGTSLFYCSVLYYMLRAYIQNRENLELRFHLIILSIFILGNIHYPVMFGSGVLELFILHLAYVIYAGSNIMNHKLK